MYTKPKNDIIINILHLNFRNYRKTKRSVSAQEVLNHWTMLYGYRNYCTAER